MSEAENMIDDPVEEPLQVKTEIMEVQETLPSDVEEEDMAHVNINYFTLFEVENTQKCIDNIRLIIKDFETQVDWHLHQYLALRGILGSSEDDTNSDNNNKGTKKIDLLNISNLMELLSNHPEGNSDFFERKRKEDTDEEEEFSDSGDCSDEDSDSVSTGAPYKKTAPKSKIGQNIKVEIEEEVHELIPKLPGPSSMNKSKNQEKNQTIDLTIMKSCKVILDRIRLDPILAIKEEAFEADEELIRTKQIMTWDELSIDWNKSVSVLTVQNVNTYNFNVCGLLNVLVVFDSPDELPEFVYSNKHVYSGIVHDRIKLVSRNVYDQLMDFFARN